MHPITGQILFLGRADGVLNPSGVRFGSADIYSVIETHFPEVADSICVGQRRPGDVDESVILFLKMNKGFGYTESLVNKIKSKIAEERSRRHVPKYVFQTWDIPVRSPIPSLLSFELQGTNKHSSDYSKFEEGRVTCQADRVRQEDQAKRNVGEP
jgi:hypothetical protein